jgi:hypothetical protein
VDPASPERVPAYLVFSQRATTEADVAAWDAQGQRFFDARVEATAGAPGEIVLSPRGAAAGAREVRAMARTDEHLALAQEADARAGDTGLARLAGRCPTVWQVARSSADDAVALRLAAVIASVELGPILDPHAGELFGVKTARAKLAALVGPGA